MPYAPQDLLTKLLRDVSRSFYLTLRVLPGKIRPQIGLTYLLARTTDTIADTQLIPLAQRLAALQALRDRLLGRTQARIDFGELSRRQAALAEATLLEQVENSLALLEHMSDADRALIRQVLDTITSGQELDLRRFADASAQHIVALSTDADLEDYTYRVAGCVGEFWTMLCRAHLFPQACLELDALLANGIRFGQGLQLVNVLRDLAADLRNGRCYLPAQALAACSIKPQDLLDTATEPRLRPVYNCWLDRAQGHLTAGWTYTNSLPRRCVRVRLACAWPLLIGRRNLELLRTGNILDPQHRIKVSRAEVRRLIARSVLYYPWTARWKALFQPAL